MNGITNKSRANFAMALGTPTKGFIDQCDAYTRELKDRAGSEKSAPLRVYLEELADRVQAVVSELENALGSSCN